MATGRVKKWQAFQHYKDRAPPWIKLHKSLLDDFDFMRLPVASRALAPCIWLLASEANDGTVSLDPEWLAFRLRLGVQEVLDGLIPLIERGFIETSDPSASTMLATCLQDAMPEREGERETEREEKQSASADADAPTRSDPIPYQSIVDAYNATMAKLPKVRELTAKRKTAIRKAWQESKSRQALNFWLAYFEECADDPFRNGTGPYREPHANWRPDFDFLIRSDQVTKVYEAAMEREGA
jgi:hypothetical protein